MVVELNKERVQEILTKILEELESPETSKKLEEAHEMVGNEMLKMMQFLFPIVVKTQVDVLKEFGLGEERETIVKFAVYLRYLEKQDEDIARLHTLIKAKYLPSLPLSKFSGAGNLPTFAAHDEISPLDDEK